MILLNDADLSTALDWQTLARALREGHRSGVDRVERSLLSREDAGPGGAEHFLVWPAWRYGAYCGAKLVSAFPGNAAKGLPTNATVYVLFDGRDGRPLAAIEGAQFTLRKTAADSALGACYLAREDAGTLLVVGAGAQAGWQVRALAHARPSIRKILVWNRTAAAAEHLAAELRLEGFDAGAADDLDAAVPRADIISCVTAATTSLLRGALLAPGTHVDLVGGFTPQMREADDDTVRRASVFVDSRRFTLDTCGDMTQPLASGVIRESDVRADLFDLARDLHPGRRSKDEITVFKNGGGGHLDLMTAVALFEKVVGVAAPA